MNSQDSQAKPEVPVKMRVMRIHRTGVLDGARPPLVAETIDTPIPGNGELLFRVHACGVCGTDIRKVRYSMVKPPVVLGHEVAGDVVEVGGAVTKFVPGDRVVVAHHAPCYTCHYCGAELSA